jgi:hypothetical protein
MSNSDQHRLIVERLLESKAVDFAAIGKALGEVGPSLALSDFEGEGFCGTMRSFVRVLYLPDPAVNPLENPLESLRELDANAGELR